MIILLYITKVFIASGILFGYYWLFLRNKKFHHYNRFYLVGGIDYSNCNFIYKYPCIFRSWQYGPRSIVPNNNNDKHGNFESN